MSNRIKLVLFLVIACALTLWGQAEKKGGGKKGPGILQPQMTVEGSSYDKPATKLGEQGSEAWTNTTMAASVNGKPLTGKTQTLTGEIIDVSCYLQVGKHGEKHKACGQKCINNGEPIGLLTSGGDVYILMAEEHDPRRDGLTTFRKAAADNFAQIVEVTGTTTQHAGYKAMYVQGFVKK
jgi:hypothetical protein